MWKDVYVALGGNIGDSVAVFNKALESFSSMPKIMDLKVSQFYRTKPVSDIPQRDYLNAVCCFKTTYSAKELLHLLQMIEVSLGKHKKPKNAPRIIDLDILFFGTDVVNEEDLEIPHPRWQERLFVLLPLLDLTSEIEFEKDGKKVRIDISSLVGKLLI